MAPVNAIAAREFLDLIERVRIGRIEHQIGAEFFSAKTRRSSIGSRATTSPPSALAASTPLDPIGPRPQMPIFERPSIPSFRQAENNVPKASVEIAAAR